jgi:hypothetical protein
MSITGRKRQKTTSLFQNKHGLSTNLIEGSFGKAEEDA